MTRILSLETSACFVVRSSVTLPGVDRQKRETKDHSSVCVYLVICNKKRILKSASRHLIAFIFQSFFPILILLWTYIYLSPLNRNANLQEERLIIIQSVRNIVGRIFVEGC